MCCVTLGATESDEHWRALWLLPCDMGSQKCAECGRQAVLGVAVSQGLHPPLIGRISGLRTPCIMGPAGLRGLHMRRVFRARTVSRSPILTSLHQPTHIGPHMGCPGFPQQGSGAASGLADTGSLQALQQQWEQVEEALASSEQTWSPGRPCEIECV